MTWLKGNCACTKVAVSQSVSQSYGFIWQCSVLFLGFAALVLLFCCSSEGGHVTGLNFYFGNFCYFIVSSNMSSVSQKILTFCVLRCHFVAAFCVVPLSCVVCLPWIFYVVVVVLFHFSCIFFLSLHVLLLLIFTYPSMGSSAIERGISNSSSMSTLPILPSKFVNSMVHLWVSVKYIWLYIQSTAKPSEVTVCSFSTMVLSLPSSMGALWKENKERDMKKPTLKWLWQ